LFVIPGAVVMLALSVIYASTQSRLFRTFGANRRMGWLAGPFGVADDRQRDFW
jgi:hypothetical protein